MLPLKRGYLHNRNSSFTYFVALFSEGFDQRIDKKAAKDLNLTVRALKIVLMRILNVLLAAYVIFGLCSCEGGTDYMKTITNASSETITLNIFPETGAGGGEVVLMPNESSEIYAFSTTAKFEGEDYSCASDIDSIQVSVTNNKTLILDLLDGSNWTLDRSGRRIELLDCSLTINDSDLQ